MAVGRRSSRLGVVTGDAPRIFLHLVRQVHAVGSNFTPPQPWRVPAPFPGIWSAWG